MTNSFRWEDQVVHVQGKQTAHMGGYGFSIGRQRLLDILAKRAMDLGVEVRFEHEVEDLSQPAGGDLIVACDGVNSRLRQLRGDSSGPDVDVGRNKYIWLGTSKVFDSFTFAVRRNGFRLDLVSRVWLQQRDKHLHRRVLPGDLDRTWLRPAREWTRASQSWGRPSSDTSMVIR